MNTKSCLLAATLSLGVAALPATADEIIFYQDFGCDGGTSDGCGAATTPQDWTLVSGDAGSDVKYESTNADWGVTETLFSDRSTRDETNPSLFSVTGRNWDIHDGEDNPYVSGYRDPSSDPAMRNENMSGNMLGHEDENYDQYEDNYYQIDGIDIASNTVSATLEFEFDSWIRGFLANGYDDVDGFAVAYAVGGSSDFSRLDPTAASAMQYRLLGVACNPDSVIGDRSLNALTGESTTCGSEIWGFDGHGTTGTTLSGSADAMAGTALFDLSGLRGQTISLRFAFASNNAYNACGDSSSCASVAEGINIDNIKVSQVCVSGSGPDCEPPGTSVPEPASVALALLGLTAYARRRRQTRRPF